MYIFIGIVTLLLVILCNERGRVHRLQREILSMQSYTLFNNDTKDDTKTKESDFKLNGIFEIHITIDPYDNYVLLLNFVMQYQTSKKMKIVLAATSVKNNQYMISYFTRKDDDALAVRNAFTIAKEMTSIGLHVVRIKIEGHNVQGTPMTKDEFYFVEKYLNKKYNNSNGKLYFEFHVKIANKKNAIFDYIELEQVIKKFSGDSQTKIGVSYNLCGSSIEKKPLLTIRVFDDGFNGAQAYKDTVMNSMKKQGYIFEDKIQQEFSIYDSCTTLDDGWL